MTASQRESRQTRETRWDHQFAFTVHEGDTAIARVTCLVAGGREDRVERDRVWRWDLEGSITHDLVKSYTQVSRSVSFGCALRAGSRGAALRVEQLRANNKTVVDGRLGGELEGGLVLAEPSRAPHLGYLLVREDGSALGQAVIRVGDGFWVAPELSEAERVWAVAALAALVYSGRMLRRTTYSWVM